MKRFAFFAVVVGLCGCALAGTGRAESITYTLQFTAAGSLGSFANAQVTFTGKGDTANVMNFGGVFFAIDVTTATVTVAGLGTATFTDSISINNFQSAGFVGWNDNLVGDMGDVINGVFATYDLKTSIGPVAGSVSAGTFVAPPFSYPTSLGSLTFTSFGDTGTFTATAIPEPASLTLLGIGAVGLIGYGWRRRQGTAA
jgi:hypothetical protein